MSKSTFEIEGRSTDRGAFTDALVIRPDGSRYRPDDEERSKTGNHWTSRWYGPVDDCLILVADITNSGKDRSYIHREPDELTPEQEIALEKFKINHWLE